MLLKRQKLRKVKANMGHIKVIALTTFRELIREKFFLVIVFVAVLLLLLSVLLGELSFNEKQKILADIGLMAIQLAAVGIALFTGSFMLTREIEKQTCLLTLSRPVSRTEFLLGKFFGIVLLNTLLVFSLALGLVILMMQFESVGEILVISTSLWLESFVVLSMVFWVSVFLRPVLSVMTGAVLFLLGHWLADLKFFAEKSKSAAFQLFAEICNWIVPNFYKFNWKNYFFIESGIDAKSFAVMLVHYMAWIGIFLMFASFQFRRKDIV